MHATNVDGANLRPGGRLLLREEGPLDDAVALGPLDHIRYKGVAGLKCHGTVCSRFRKINSPIAKSGAYVRSNMARAAEARFGEHRS